MFEKNKNSFTPDWRVTAPEKNSFRSIFKWGSPLGFKHPNDRLYKLLKETFKLTDNDFKTKTTEGNEKATLDKSHAASLSTEQAEAFEKIVGKENINSDDYSRIKFSSGKTTEEALELRNQTIKKVSDLVVHPRDKEDIQKIIQYCNNEKIPVYVYGGGSSVNLGFRPEKGGITLVMSTHMNKLLEFNETNKTATVEAGIMGPAYEALLNNAPELYNARFPYTCGHFPQSFEFSSAGGWIVTKGSGQASSFYGDAVDLVISQEYVTPAGSFKTLDIPSTATGPMINDIMKGSEGAYGILVNLTLKVFRYMPKNRKKFSFIFPSWQDAVNATREISQGEFGMPSVLRISDPEETFVGLKQHGIEGTILDKIITARGYEPMQRCLCLGHTEGEKTFSKSVYKNVKRICKQYGGMSLTSYPVKKWEHGKFADPYLREDLNDYGIIIDTLETGLTWENLHKVHMGVRKYIKKRPETICLTHCSHFYQQGTNLYFIFIGRFESWDEYKEFHCGIIDKINEFGGSLSHHHGVGKMIGPWMEKHLGEEQLNILKAIKKHFDPNNIMNPGGLLGMD